MAQITIVLTVRHVASIAGYFVSGFCYDKFKRQSFWIIIALLFAEFIGNRPGSVTVNTLTLMCCSDHTFMSIVLHSKVFPQKIGGASYASRLYSVNLIMY